MSTAMPLSPRSHVKVLQAEIMQLKEQNLLLEKQIEMSKEHPMTKVLSFLAMSTPERRTLGTSKYRIQKFLSIDTLWLITLGIVAGTSRATRTHSNVSSCKSC